MAAETITNEKAVIEALATEENTALHYVLEGLLEHFLPFHDDDDLQWFLEIANSPPVMKSLLSSNITTIQLACCVKDCLLRVLTKGDDDDSGSGGDSDEFVRKMLTAKVIGTLYFITYSLNLLLVCRHCRI